MTELANDFTLEWYLVAFLDVLGQREELCRLRRLPKTAQEHLATAEVLRSTVGSVLSFRTYFQGYFKGFSDGLASPPPASQSASATTKRLSAKYRGFSDSFLISVALRNDDEHLTPCIGIFATLVAACGSMCTSFARSRPLRGGIEVGLGIQIGPEEVYGPALERAYALERHDAKHPRLMIGDELWNYLTAIEAQASTGANGRVAKQLVLRAKELIISDTDGKRILDYLGPAFLKNALPGLNRDVIEPAYKFVVQQHQHWQHVGNEDLSSRYSIVRRYFEDRLALWGLTSSGG